MLAYSSWEREYARRVLRSLGYAPLVFTNLDELAEMGVGATTLDMLYLGNMPVTDSKGREVLEGVRASIGPDVPVLHAGLHQDIRPKSRGVSASPPRSFSDYYRLILSFLNACRFEGARPHLSWGSYAFDPLGRTVAFAGRTVRLEPAAFDVALEFFFYAGRTLTTKRLKQVMHFEKAALRLKEDYLACTITTLKTELCLSGVHGWALETVESVGYRLIRVDPALSSPATEASSRPLAGAELESQ